MRVAAVANAAVRMVHSQEGVSEWSSAHQLKTKGALAEEEARTAWHYVPDAA